MTRVGIKELSDHTSEIVRRVREEQETIELTFHSEVFAQIVPVVPVVPKEWDVSFEERLKRRRRLAEEAGKYWPEGLTAAQAIAEDRR
jgi:antitoxin (DNA-binding transcriptional repressor) of toxin-antitoxin stability system